MGLSSVYKKSKLVRVDLGIASRTDTFVTYDMKQHVPERIWKNLSVSNFGCVLYDATAQTYGTGSGETTYNKSTGILTWYTGNQNGKVRITMNVFCLYAD